MVGEFARRQPRAFQIGIDDVVPVFLGMLEKRLRDDDAGIVDEDRQRSEPVFRRRDRIDDALPVGHVAGDRQAGAAIRRDAVRQFGKPVGAARRGRDLGAGGGENFGKVLADAAGRAGDERDLAGDVEAG